MSRPPRYAEFSIHDRSTGMLEMIHVYRGADGSLRTRTFFEKASHGGEVDSYDPVDWKHKVPEGVLLRGSNGGAGSGAIPNYWVAWREADSLKALSIYQDDPLAVPMPAEDSLIDGPLLELDGKLHVYFLRKARDGYDLWEHVFTGEAKKKGHAATAKLAFIAGEPLFIRADPIARFDGFKHGENRPGTAGIAAFGWLTRDGSGMSAHGAWQDSSGIELVDSDPIAGYAPFPGQRIGLWANPDSSRLHLAWIMRRIDNDTLRPAEWTVWAKAGTRNLRIESRGLGGAKVHAVASVIRRSDHSPDTYCYYLTKTGRLYEQSRTETRKLREGVPLDYDFPIFASFQGAWDARMDAKGEVRISSPGWPE